MQSVLFCRPSPSLRLAAMAKLPRLLPQSQIGSLEVLQPGRHDAWPGGGLLPVVYALKVSFLSNLCGLWLLVEL